MLILRVVPFLLVTATAVAAQSNGDKPRPGRASGVALPGEIKWSPAPAVLPRGAQLAVIEGDPTKAGEFTMRLRMPANYRIPPHFHPATENITVIQGTFFLGMGDTFDPKRGSRMPVGAFGAVQPGMHHFAWTEGETIIQLHGMGPWKLTYVNPADDPSRKGR
jgi:ChrR-like protein with cupin domain